MRVAPPEGPSGTEAVAEHIVTGRVKPFQDGPRAGKRPVYLA